MSRGSRFIALFIAILFIAVGVMFMIWRIGSVIGWSHAASGWWVIALLVGLILFISFLIYLSIKSKLNR